MPGYRDPPVHSRFKPGQSGNPAGGPRGPRRKPVHRRSTYLAEEVTCTIGGKRFTGQRREVVVRLAALWSITKPVQGSKARNATEQEKLPKPNFALQQLLHKLMEQEEKHERLIQREEPVFAISDMPSRPDYVSCIEDAAEVCGFGVKSYHKQKSARVLLDNRIVAEGFAGFGDRRLTREEQKQVLAATRFPKKMKWPDWWEADLRERGKGWRAPAVAKNVTEPKPPKSVRIGFRDYMVAVKNERFLREEIDYARWWGALPQDEQELFRAPFTRPDKRS